MGRRKCKGGSHLADWTSFFSGGSIAHEWLNYSLWQSRALITLSLSLEPLSCLILQVRTLLGCLLEAHVGFANTRQEGGDTQMVQSGDFKQAFEAKGEEGRKEGRKEGRIQSHDCKLNNAVCHLSDEGNWYLASYAIMDSYHCYQQCSTSHLATLLLRHDQTSIDCLTLAIKKTTIIHRSNT